MGCSEHSADRQRLRVRVENALLYVAEMVGGVGGEVYVPLFERLEKELEAFNCLETAVERARRLTAEA